MSWVCVHATFALYSTILTFFHYVASFCHGAKLQYLTGLRSLTIDLAMSGTSMSSYEIELLASTLDQIPSSILTRVRLLIPCPGPSLHIGRVGEVLQQGRFSQLTDVEILVCWAPRPSERLEECIRRDLHVLEERGILSFHAL